jgi:hypothetical protein
MNLDAFIFISTFGILLSAVNNIIVNNTYLSPISLIDLFIPLELFCYGKQTFKVLIATFNLKTISNQFIVRV